MSPRLEPSGPPDLITVAEAAQMLGVTVGTLSLWRKRGVIPAYTVAGTVVRLRRTEVEALICVIAEEEL